MGHKEDLLAGAKKCLRELGYANTTARDIVAASGTNLASIGYHFGSKDALMTAAIVEMLGDWGQGLDEPSSADQPGYVARFRAQWQALIAAIKADPQLAIASFENAAHALRMPQLLPIIAAGQEDARTSFGEDFASSDADADTQRAVGSLMLAITTGLIAQWLIDPAKSPSPDDLVAGFRHIGEAFTKETTAAPGKAGKKKGRASALPPTPPPRRP